MMRKNFTEKTEKNEYSLDLFQPRRYQKTTSWKSCSAFSLKRKGKKTMQDDLTDFQEDIPTRKCFCVACTNTWNSHCQLHIEAAFSNITQMCHEPCIKIESIYIKHSRSNKKRLLGNTGHGLQLIRYVLTVTIIYWSSLPLQLSFHNVHSLTVTIVCRICSFKRWKIRIACETS